MTRTLTILAAAAALAVSAETASAGTSNKPEQPRTESYTLSNAMISGFSAKPGQPSSPPRSRDGMSTTSISGSA